MRTSLAFVMLLAGASSAMAQQVTVQQPQVQVFEVDTVVSVPDRGRAFLGGVNSAATGRTSGRGLTGNTGIGGATSGSSATAHVFIHDFEAMDAELLRQPATASRLRPSASASSFRGGDDPARDAEALRGLKRYRRQLAADGTRAWSPGRSASR